MAFFKNTNYQIVYLFIYDKTTGVGQTDEGFYSTIDFFMDGVPVTAATTYPTEIDYLEWPGWYYITVDQPLTNCESLLLVHKSSTPNVVCDPIMIFPTHPQTEPDLSGVPQSVWEYATRTLSSAGLTAQDVWEYATRTLTTAPSSLTAQEVWEYGIRSLTDVVNQISILSAVDGEDITVHQYDTWNFTIDSTLLTPLLSKDNVIFVVKKNAGDPDSSAILLVDSVNGLTQIGRTAPSLSSAGSLVVNSDTSFTVTVDMEEVANKVGSTYYGAYQWWLKTIVNGPPDTGFTIMKGGFDINEPGTLQIA